VICRDLASLLLALLSGARFRVELARAVDEERTRLVSESAPPEAVLVEA
jgi:hypothetical protein